VIAAGVEQLGLWLVVVAALLGASIVVKFVLRRRYLRRLRTATISPEALEGRLDAGEDVSIVDLRTPREASRRAGGAGTRAA
jgi:hypothetical protein